jgi:hypothetical protein
MLSSGVDHHLLDLARLCICFGRAYLMLCRAWPVSVESANRWSGCVAEGMTAAILGAGLVEGSLKDAG